MKICITFLTYSENAFAGIENSIYNLAKGFLKGGHKVVIYTSNIVNNGTEDPNIKVIRSLVLPAKLPYGNKKVDNFLLKIFSKNGALISQEFAAAMETEKADLIIAVDALWGIYLQCELWKAVNIPVVFSLHVLNTPYLLQRISQIPYKFIRVVSEDLHQKVSFSINLKDVITIPNSIDLDLFYPAANLNGQEKYIFCNSRIDPNKGISYLIKAFVKIRKEHPEFQLILCNGDFPFGYKSKELNKVNELIKRYELRNSVILLPNQKWNDVPGIIRKSYVVILPTFYESFGRGALETLACGVPLICTNVGNLTRLVKNNALLVNKKSSQQIYKAFKMLINDPALYYRLSVNGPLIAREYSNVHIAETFLTNLK